MYLFPIGRPAKNPTPVATTSAASSSSAAKKVAGNQQPQVEPGPTSSAAPLVKASQIASGPRRSSLQQQAELLRSRQIASTVTIASDGNTSDESMVTSTTTITTNFIKSEADPQPMDVSPPSPSVEATVVNGSQLRLDTVKTEAHSTGGRKLSTEENSENNGTTTPSPSSSTIHIIPRLTDNPGCCENVDPHAWGPQEVVEFLDTNDCGAHSELFQRNVSSLTKNRKRTHVFALSLQCNFLCSFIV